MKRLDVVLGWFSILVMLAGCASVVPVAKNLRKSSDRLKVDIIAVNIGPNSITRGKSTYTPMGNDIDMIHVTIEITNTTQKDLAFDFRTIKLVPKNQEGKTAGDGLTPSYYRFFAVSFTGDIADDAKTMTGGDASVPVTIPPGGKVERTLVYLLHRNFKPAKILFPGEKNLEFAL